MPAGRPAFEPNEKQRTAVSILAACGTAHEVICTQIVNPQTGKPIDDKTLRKVFRRELKDGKERANAMVKKSLFMKATGNGNGATAAAIFWLKTQCGWKEPAQGHELTGKDGAPLAPPSVEVIFSAAAGPDDEPEAPG